MFWSWVVVIPDNAPFHLLCNIKHFPDSHKSVYYKSVVTHADRVSTFRNSPNYFFIDKSVKVSERLVLERTLIIALIGRNFHGIIYSKWKCIVAYSSVIYRKIIMSLKWRSQFQILIKILFSNFRRHRNIIIFPFFEISEWKHFLHSWS